MNANHLCMDALKPLHLFPSALQGFIICGKFRTRWQIATINEDFNLTMGQSPPGSTVQRRWRRVCHFIKVEKILALGTQLNASIAPRQNDLLKKRDTLVSVRAPVGDINMVKERVQYRSRCGSNTT